MLLAGVAAEQEKASALRYNTCYIVFVSRSHVETFIAFWAASKILQSRHQHVFKPFLSASSRCSYCRLIL
jgi:hypothetical protein